ncbi:hypothetical protein [Pectobacterium parmentieri]|nr:hypothetical protein [Pectobacterium parmentieri]
MDKGITLPWKPADYPASLALLGMGYFGLPDFMPAFAQPDS